MSVSAEVKQAAAEFSVSTDQLKQYMNTFLSDLNKGLAKDTHDTAIVKAYVTYVQDLPTGKEEGKFIGLDVGGSNFRVLLAELGGGKCDTKFETYVLPVEVYTGSREEFFDLLAEYIAKTLNNYGVAMDNLPLGLTFSFPLSQRGLRVGILERWTKKFNIKDVIGNDVVQFLKEALDKRSDLKVNIVAILNDTTGTLVSCAFDHPDCAIGMILGTGTNACYLEKQSEAPLFDEPDNGSGNVIINTEWGAFGDNGSLDFVRLEYDKEVDETSVNPGKQINEKMISGLYLGEITRLALKKYMRGGIMLNKKCTCPLSKSGSFKTKFVSFIEEEPDGVFTECKKIFSELGVPTLSDDDCAAIKYVCSQISRRAASLCAAGLSALVNKMGKDEISIGIDGAMYKKHPKVAGILEEVMLQLVDPNYKFKIVSADDGSGKGAALVATVAKKE